MSTNRKDRALFHQDLSYDYPTLERGESIYVWDDMGKRYIDGGAGATNVTLGHGRRRVVEAMAEQAAKLAFCFSAHFTNQPAQDLAARIAALAPADLNHVYFVSGGSEGIEVSFKIARQYHLQRGNQAKHLVIGRWGSYHGATLGALSATGLPPSRASFAPPCCALSPISLPAIPTDACSRAAGVSAICPAPASWKRRSCRPVPRMWLPSWPNPSSRAASPWSHHLRSTFR